MRGLLLVNPGSRKGEGTRSEVAALLAEQGVTLIEASEENPANFPEVIERFANKIDLAIVGGGDGTIRSVIRVCKETQTPLAILPLGTANNLARNLGVPKKLADACGIIAEGNIQRIDLGEVNGRYFLNVAGLGLSTEINRGVEPQLKRRWGVIAYLVTAWKVLSRTGQFRARIVCDGIEHNVKSLQITVCNGRHYGAGMTIAQDATIEDEQLHLCSTTVDRWWKGILLLPRLWKGRGENCPGICVIRGKSIEVHTRRRMWIDTDGEVITHTPAVFRVLPKALRVIAPPLPDGAERSEQKLHALQGT